MQDRKMLLHFLHSLHPCNLAIADDCKESKDHEYINRLP